MQLKIVEEYLVINTREEILFINLCESLNSDDLIVKDYNTTLKKNSALEIDQVERFSISNDKTVLTIFNSDGEIDIYELENIIS